MRTLSVIIISKDEEDRITPCLESVKDFADEIIVFDSSSTDKTVEIVRKYTDKVWITEDWPGDGFQKQRALEKAQCEWVLNIDADEWLDENMKDEIRAVLSQETIKEQAFKLAWGNVILNKQLKYGRSSRAIKRLFLREGAAYTKVKVHGSVPTKGKVGVLKKGFLMHNSLRGFDHLMTKMRLYSWETSVKYFNNKKPSYGIPLAVFRALYTFLLIYIFRLGFLDGSRGLMMAIVFSQSSFNKYAGLWYLEQSEKIKNTVNK
ncbi:glycosyltransferase family 2 protein [Thalassotalea psychrophila]|uniref:Glycosyltransferase family 2 protein n=1 Tax=Thalassotalea psychrophila TaxID=3065647 RepID=A0ABY9TWD9_9GAMM|nr:glycosyltransferase family 2 protein [Colwelliaceae bacterium SQ149]